jgi:excisionase family DNA binding protein
MNEKQSGKLLFTYKEAAAVAGVSDALMRKLAATGKVEKVKIGKAARIPRHALMALCGVKE